jgi:hypothetical protein
MAKQPSQKLAEAMEKAHRASTNNIVRSHRLTKPEITILKKAGFLKTILNGWYLLDGDVSQQGIGTSALWHESYWAFIAQYLQEAVGSNYLLSAEQSMDLHTGITASPLQVLVGNTEKVNRVVPLPNGMSLSLYTLAELPDEMDVYQGVNIYALEDALVKVGPAYFRREVQTITLALQRANDHNLIRRLLTGGHLAAASRLAGAYNAIGMTMVSDNIVSAMRSVGFDQCAPVNPFAVPVSGIAISRPKYPHVARLEVLWQDLAAKITAMLPAAVDTLVDIEFALKQVEDVYVQDAYNSLSIEGYRVTPELIERVRSGEWRPEEDERDKRHQDGLAAKGYYDAHIKVKDAIGELYRGSIAIDKLGSAVMTWYRALFGPMVTSGLLKPGDLAGYRNRPVFIRGSRHTPFPAESLMDAMDAIFECAKNTPHPLARAILCHWAIGYVHPFPDGNGRSARFLMNALLVSAGYPWTIIQLKNRNQYMAALELLSVGHNPEPFVAFILKEQEYSKSLISEGK